MLARCFALIQNNEIPTRIYCTHHVCETPRAAESQQRMAAILDELLVYSPDVLLMQEVTDAMYEEIKRRLVEWKLFRQKEQAEVYFNVTATKFPGDGVGRASRKSCAR